MDENNLPRDRWKLFRSEKNSGQENQPLFIACFVLLVFDPQLKNR